MSLPSPRFIGQLALPAILLIGTQLRSAPPAGPRAQSDEIESLVSGLGSDSFATRQRSASRLRQSASRSDVTAEQIKSALRDNPFPTTDLELYLAKRRLLDELELSERDLCMDRFLHDPTFDDRAVPGWEQFRRYAGNGIDARLVYAAVLTHRPEIGRRLGAPGSGPIRIPSFDEIDREDIATWSILLWAASEQSGPTADEDTLRLSATLSRVGGGPEPSRDHERRVLSRLIASYLERAPVDSRDRMVIGVRYDCAELVESACRRILNDPAESPSRIVTAMLAASVLDFSPAEVDDWVTSFLNDGRVSHVWRSMMPPKTTHRTQVRDVALALKLHRSGIDPRTRGFVALVADPVLVFRPYSLGFESEDARRKAHAR